MNPDRSRYSLISQQYIYPMKKNKSRSILSLKEENLLENKRQLILLIEKLLTDLLSQTRSLSRSASIFDCVEPPSITLLDYLSRIAKFIRCSGSVFIGCLLYIDRLQQAVPDFIINDYNVHRLIITSIMLAAKYLDDFYYTNEFYARVGGIPLQDINKLELFIMESFDFSIHITQKEFISYLRRIVTFQQVRY